MKTICPAAETTPHTDASPFHLRHPIRTSLAVAALGAALLIPLPAGAQEAAGGEVQPNTDGTAHGEPTFDFHFGGGMLPEFIDQLAIVSREPVNVVIPENARRTVIPEMNLLGVTTEDVIVLVNEVGIHCEPEPFELSRATNSAWVVNTRSRRQTSPQIAFHPIARLLASHTIEDVSTTVATAWEMLELPGDALAHIKFHEDTGLLIVTGPPEVLTLVGSALQALGAEARSEAEQALQAELETTRREVARAQYEEELHRELTETRSVMVVERMKQETELLRDENAELRAELRDLQSELAKQRGSQ